MPGIYCGISEEMQTRIIELWKSGLCGADIGRTLGIAPSTATKFIRKYLENKDKKPIDVEVYEKLKLTFDGGKIRALRNAHWSAKAIAEDMLIDEAYVLRYIQEEGM